MTFLTPVYYIVNLSALFSGGEDSILACYRIMEENNIACLITLIFENVGSYIFHTQTSAMRLRTNMIIKQAA